MHNTNLANILILLLLDFMYLVIINEILSIFLLIYINDIFLIYD